MRIATTRALRAAALFAGLACCGALVSGADAQTVVPASEEEVADGPIDELDPTLQISETVVDLAAWVIASGDNRDLPFAVIDKNAAQILVFNADGRVRGLAPALLGSAVGDHSAPGVADLALKDIPAADKTTPAGRYLAGYGPAAGGERVLWVDYASAVSIHPMATGNKREKRKERLASLDTADNRITHGCINVSDSFYKNVVNATFAKGGVFYILPDTMTLADAFPGFAMVGGKTS